MVHRQVVAAFLLCIAGSSIPLLPASASAHGNPIAVCGSSPGDRAGVEMVMMSIESACPCASFQSHSRYLSCAKKVIESERRARGVSKQCIADVVRHVSFSTCGRPGRLTCCEVLPHGRSSCRLVHSAEQCRGTTGTGTSCYDACKPSCDELSLTDEEIGQAVSAARSKVRANPDADLWSQMVRGTVAELQCALPPPGGSRLASRVPPDLSSQSLPIIGPFDPSARYCGPGYGTADNVNACKSLPLVLRLACLAKEIALHPPVTCMNEPCYEHDECYSENCVPGFSDLKLCQFPPVDGNPDAVSCDRSFFDGCAKCSESGASVIDRVVCAVAEGLQAVPRGDLCPFDSCPSGQACTKDVGKCEDPSTSSTSSTPVRICDCAV